MLSEPVALNNHPRTWPKDHRCDLQSRHRQLAATRSLSRPIITETYSAKCSPLLHGRSFASVPFLFFFSVCPPSPPTQPSYTAPRRSGRYRFISLLFGPATSDNQGVGSVVGWTASLIRSNYAGRLKRFNCPTRRNPSSDFCRVCAGGRDFRRAAPP